MNEKDGHSIFYDQHIVDMKMLDITVLFVFLTVIYVDYIAIKIFIHSIFEPSLCQRKEISI